MTDQPAMTEEQYNELERRFSDSLLVQQYRTIRDFLKAEAEAQAAHVKPHAENMAALANELHRRLLKRNPNWKPGMPASGSTEHGTFFLKTNNSIKVADRAAFHAFLLADPATRVPEFTTAHVAKEAVEGYVESIEQYRREHGGALPPGVTSELPPGISIDRITELQVRKT
jgi:hypothetical protein